MKHGWVPQFAGGRKAGGQLIPLACLLVKDPRPPDHSSSTIHVNARGSLPLACRASLPSEGSCLDHVISLQPSRVCHVAHLPIVRSCLGPLNQWPRPLPHLSSTSMSSHRPITATSHLMAPMRQPVKIYFGSKEGGDSSVAELRHLFLDSQHQGEGGPPPNFGH